MTGIIHILGRSMAVGGKWLLPADKHEAAKEIKANRDRLVVDFKHGTERVVGSFEPSKKAKGQSYAAALAVGLAELDAVVVQELDSDLVWVAALREGIPLANYDVLCGSAEARQILTDMLSYNPSAVVVGNTSEASKTLEEVLGRLTKKQWQSVRLQLPHKARLVRILAFMILFFLLVGGAGGAYMYILQQQKHAAMEENQRRLSLAQMMESREEAARRAKWQRDVQEAIDRQQQEFYLGATPGEFAAAVKVLLAGLPTIKDGWKLDALSCSSIEPTCTAQWSDWEGLGTPVRAAGLPGAPEDELALLGKSLQTPVPGLGLIPRSVGRASRDNMLGFASLAAEYKFVQLTITPAINEVKAKLPPKPQNVQEAVQPPTLGRVMDWSLQGAVHQVLPVLGKINIPGARVISTKLTALSGSEAPAISLQGQLLVE